MFDSSNTLRIKQRHKGVVINNSKIKGHPLSEKTMLIAVPAINISIYINPTFVFLVQIALITVTVEEAGTQIGNNYKLIIFRYITLTIILLQ
jgi:hypothetical protein